MTIAEQSLEKRRVQKVRDICHRAIAFDEKVMATSGAAGHRTDRMWLAFSVLNILDGKIDSDLSG